MQIQGASPLAGEPLTGRFFVKPLGKMFGRVGAGVERMWCGGPRGRPPVEGTCAPVLHTGHPQGAPLYPALPLPLRDPRLSAFCRSIYLPPERPRERGGPPNLSIFLHMYIA